MAKKSTDRSYLRELVRSRSGMVGLVMLILLFGTAVYVLVAVPQSEAYKWDNPAAWQGNPVSAPPSWVNYFGEDAPTTVSLPLTSWTPSVSAGIYTYTATASLAWDHAVSPSDFAVSPVFNGTAYEVSIAWTKPDGTSIPIILTSPESGSFYDLTDSSIQQSIIPYIQGQTSLYLSAVTPRQEVAALFNKAGPSILNNTVEQGTYSVTVQVIAGAPQAVSPLTSVTLVGDSYGSMGTDSVGRPISLGVLAGLPWALEIGIISSIGAVLGGVLWGGLSGFIGGWKDQVMQWGSLVILALPGLVFLVALSYSTTLTVLTEALILAGLSWPFFAIIARSVTLSIRSQTYVEADRAMGISSTRSFFTHVLPRLTPVTVAYTALSVPAGIITAETLAFLGIEQGNIITWGGILNSAITFDASVHGWWWWVLFPGIMIFVASIPFVMVGFALDRIVAPRVNAK
ncbi:MAG: ABC transporter permease [Thaumarchaeota archaeon]|nr:ABC transporter permease [Nitrososphaerota archaeon]